MPLFNYLGHSFETKLKVWVQALKKEKGNKGSDTRRNTLTLLQFNASFKGEVWLLGSDEILLEEHFHILVNLLVLDPFYTKPYSVKVILVMCRIIPAIDPRGG